MTVRDMVRERCDEMLTAPPPSRLRDILIEFTGLHHKCLNEVREAEHAYALVLLRCLDAGEAANRAKIRAQVSPEYGRKREADDTTEIVIETIRSIKASLRSLDEEMRLAR